MDRGDGGSTCADEWEDGGSAGASPAPVAEEEAPAVEEPAGGASVDATMCSPSCGGRTFLGDEGGDLDLTGDFPCG